VEEVSLYAYWGAIWPDNYNLIYIDNPFISQSQWVTPQGWIPNDYYYALEHFSRFVRPGLARFTAWTNQAGLRVSAFQKVESEDAQPDPRLAAETCRPRGSCHQRMVVIVALNTSTGAAVNVEIGFKGIAGSTSAVYRTGFGDTTERFASIGPLDQNNAVQIPAQGAVTIVLGGAR
jgi:O-glycosyl hydrolase